MIERRESGPPLSPMALDLLRLSAPHGDIRRWRQLVFHLADRYPGDSVARGLDTLHIDGFITNHGAPYKGWLTAKGRAVLAGDVPPPPEIIERVLPAQRLTFAQFDRTLKHEYWRTLLADTRGNVSKAASLSGCARTTVIYHLRRLNLRAREFRES